MKDAQDRTRPAFLVTIDTEGDNLWSCPSTVTTENARYLPRFQTLCERHGLRPTWLVNYEMAHCPVARELGRDVLARDAGEIGMHLHAWNSPPAIAGDPKVQSYLTEFPEHVMRAKVQYLTNCLEQQFQRKMSSHRAGRWGMNCTYARLLVEAGYRVDCSVTPHLSWKTSLGDPQGTGGPDYTSYPTLPYLLDLGQIDRPGDSSLLEVPVTIVKANAALHRAARLAPPLLQRALRRRFPAKACWLRPNGLNRDSMLGIVRRGLRRRWPCAVFVLHSSELMPGGSPTFRTDESIESLYTDLDVLFREAAKAYRGATLSEFYAEWIGRRQAAPRPAR